MLSRSHVSTMKGGDCQMLRDDLTRSYEHGQGNKWAIILRMSLAPGIRAVTIYRFSYWVYAKPSWVRSLLKSLSLLLRRHMGSKWGIDIDPRATIGKGFRIVHYGGIFIGSQVVIGENLHLSHDVTIGLAGTGKNRGAPTLGNNVFISPGAKIVGKINIGHNVKIGANAVVDRNVPDNALVQTASSRVVVFSSYGEDDTKR
jgi:serine O-acetyltransferase